MSRANRPEMGIATAQSAENKGFYLSFLESFNTGQLHAVEKAAASIFTSDAQINASHPINEATVGKGYVDNVIAPIMAAFEGFTRQNYIVLGGEYLGSEWVTSTGYFHGLFNKPLCFIPPSGKLAFLRFGEFHRMEGGKIVESHVFLGFAELIIALGLWPLSPSQGYEGAIPGPATHDGIDAAPSDSKQSRASADLVEGMLKKLASEDEAWRPYWHERMVWYGPGGLGSYATVDAFADFQRPFELTFDGWAMVPKLASKMWAPTVKLATETTPFSAVGPLSPASMSDRSLASNQLASGFTCATVIGGAAKTEISSRIGACWTSRMCFCSWATTCSLI